MTARLHLFASRWEGVYAADFSLEQVRRRCYALGEELLTRGWSCLVACDTRFMSSIFARDIYRTLQVQGVSVSLVPSPTPVPAVQYALDQRRASCALVVTARNMPYWYNGLTLLSTQPDALLEHVSSATLPDSDAPFPPPETGDGAPQDLRGQYLDLLRGHLDIDLIRRTAMTVFVDPMHGTTAGYIPAAIGEGGQTKAIEINRETDPLFSRTTPHPVGAALTRLRKLVRESDSNVGLALSADGSALNVVDKGGEQVDLSDLTLLLASYLSRQHRQRGLVIAPAVTDALPGLAAWEDALGLKVELTTTPGPRIAEVLAQGRTNLVVGCTGEGEFVMSRMGPYADGLYAAILTIELLARSGGNLRALVDELRVTLRGKGP